MLRRAASVTAMVVMAAGAAQAQGGKIIVAEQFGPKAGFALETDDGHVLMRAGCLEALARVGFDGRLEPALAVSWQQTSPTTWEFKLRPNVKFQDGQALTAEAVSKALTTALNVKTPARGFSPRVVKSIEAAGLDVVKVTTPAPSVLVPFVMASPNTGVLSPAAYTADGKINPIGTCSGPFAITEVNGQQSLTLKRNDGYWGDKVQIAAAEVRFLPDANVRATQVRTGESHIGRTVPAACSGTTPRAAVARVRWATGTAGVAPRNWPC